MNIIEPCGRVWLERANWIQHQPCDPTLDSGTLQVGIGSLKLSGHVRDAFLQQALNGASQKPDYAH